MAKRAGYREAVEWIAHNDDHDLGDEEVGYTMTVCMVADLWGKECFDVAEAVRKYRFQMQKARK